MTDQPTTPRWPAGHPVEIDSTVAHSARVYDYLLGGSDNFAVDRDAARQVAAFVGGMDNARAEARANRAFLGRAVRWLAAEAGIRQFLDIGTGIPNADNVQTIALRAAPDARVVSVDHDPVVLAHAHQLLGPGDPARTAYVQADLRDPDVILARAARTLDLAEPVALLLVGVLHHVADPDDPHAIVAHLVRNLAPGSYLAVSHLATSARPCAAPTGAEPRREPAGTPATAAGGAPDDPAGSVTGGVDRVMQQPRVARDRAAVDPAGSVAGGVDRVMQQPWVARDRAAVERFFRGLVLVEPGIVQVDGWRLAGAPESVPGAWVAPLHVGVGRKP